MPKKIKLSADSPLRRIERKAAQDAIREAIAAHGSRVNAAAALGISTQTLRQKLGR